MYLILLYIIQRALVKSRFPRSDGPIALVDGFLHDNVMVQNELYLKQDSLQWVQPHDGFS